MKQNSLAANKPLGLAVRVVLLALGIAVAYSVDWIGFRLERSGLENLGWILGLGLLQSIVLSYILVRATWHGWKLLLTLFLVYWGITVFQTEIESVVFLQYLVSVIPANDLPRLILNGTIIAALVAILAVFIHDKWTAQTEAVEKVERLPHSPWQWAWKLTALALIYLVIYFLFGALVAKPLAGAAFDEFYGNLQLPVWILPFQLFRGIVWVAITLPLIRTMKGTRAQVGLGVALLLSVPISSLVLPPNPFLPPAIRLAHLVELFTSMFLFGWLDVWILTHGTQPKALQRDRLAARPA